MPKVQCSHASQADRAYRTGRRRPADLRVLELLIFRDGGCHVSIDASGRSRRTRHQVPLLLCGCEEYLNEAAVAPSFLRHWNDVLFGMCLSYFPKVQLTVEPPDRPNNCNLGVSRVAYRYF